MDKREICESSFSEAPKEYDKETDTTTNGYALDRISDFFIFKSTKSKQIVLSRFCQSFKKHLKK